MRYSIFFLFLFPFISNVYAQRNAVKGKTSYDFWVDESTVRTAGGKSPILLFLHGKSLSGSDLSRVQRYGLLYAIDRGHRIPGAIVVAPQTSNGWNPDQVLEVLDYVLENYNADASRDYETNNLEELPVMMGSFCTSTLYLQKGDRIRPAAFGIADRGPVQQLNQRYNRSKRPFFLQEGFNVLTIVEQL